MINKNYEYCQRREMNIITNGLWETLGITFRKGMIISIVGGGGKTSVMYQLARELFAQGKGVIMTTTTHIKKPDEFPVLYAKDRPECRVDFFIKMQMTPVVIGHQSSNEGKLSGLSKDEVRRLQPYADVILVEADGAKHLPLKVPAKHEPVIVSDSVAVIAVVGLDCINKAIKETCFRKELASAFLHKGLEEVVEPADVAYILTNEQGSRKDVGKIPYRVILNKADTKTEYQHGLEIIDEMNKIKKEKCIITCLKSRCQKSHF
jgi:probable selenium-dependent hydroxylase accessory protein YqeC